jgi:hypothetical protein
MRPIIVGLVVIGVVMGCDGFSPALSQTPAERVRFEVENVGLHPGMEPGMYICARGHLHIKGTVQNLTKAPLETVKVSAKAFDANGNLLGTATASTPRNSTIAPGHRGEINIEFLTVTGETIDKVKRHEVTVVDAVGKR